MNDKKIINEYLDKKYDTMDKKNALIVSLYTTIMDLTNFLSKEGIVEDYIHQSNPLIGMSIINALEYTKEMRKLFKK